MRICLIFCTFVIFFSTEWQSGRFWDNSECDKTPQCNQEQDSGAVAKVIWTLISRMNNFNHPNFYSNVEQELFKTYIHTQGAGRCKLKKEVSYAGETSHVKRSGVLFVALRG